MDIYYKAGLSSETSKEKQVRMNSYQSLLQGQGSPLWLQYWENHPMEQNRNNYEKQGYCKEGKQNRDIHSRAFF